MMRHLSFKLPIVLRYTGMAVLLFGLFHTIVARKLRFTPYLLASPLFVGWLCHK